MHAFEKKNLIPLYLQVADWIRGNVYDGSWNYGEQIPSENQIVESLNVSRGTVKKAISILCEEGLLTQIQGKGTFVTNSNISYPLGKGLLSFAESLSEQNLNFTTEVVTQRIEKANSYVAKNLQVEEGSDVFYLERIRSVEGEKVMLIENRINLNLCRGLDKVDFAQKSLFESIEQISGKKIRYSQSKYAARIIGQERAEFLQISKDAPVLHLEQIVHLETDEVIDFGNVWLKSNKYYLGTVYQR